MVKKCSVRYMNFRVKIFTPTFFKTSASKRETKLFWGTVMNCLISKKHIFYFILFTGIIANGYYYFIINSKNIFFGSNTIIIMGLISIWCIIFAIVSLIHLLFIRSKKKIAMDKKNQNRSDN